MPLQATYPILLPKENVLTYMLIKVVHINSMHGGNADALAYLKKNYWIPEGRQVVEKALKLCQRYRRCEAKALPYS